MSFLAFLLLATTGLPTAADHDAEVPPDCIIPAFDTWTTTLPYRSPDRRWLVAMSNVWHGWLISTVNPEVRLALPESLSYIAFSHDSKWLVFCGGREQNYAIYDLRDATTPRCLGQYSAPNAKHIGFTEDGRLLAITYAQNRTESWLLDAEPPFGEDAKTSHFYLLTDKWRVETVGSTELRFTRRQEPTISRSLSISEHAQLLIPDMAASYSLFFQGAERPSKVNQRDWLLVCDGDQLLVLDLRSDDVCASARTISHQMKPMNSARIAADGSWVTIPQPKGLVFVNVSRGTVCTLDTAGSLEWGGGPYSNEEETGLELSSDQRWLLYCGSVLNSNASFGFNSFKARLWDVKRLTARPVVKIDNGTMDAPLDALSWRFVFSDDSRWLTGLPQRSDVRFWDLQQPVEFEERDEAFPGEESRKLKSPAARPRVLSDDRKVLGVYDAHSRAVLVYRLATPASGPIRLELGQRSIEPDTMMFIPNSNEFLVLADGRFAMWDLDADSPVPTVVGPNPGIARPRSTRFVPGTKILIAEMNREIIACDFMVKEPSFCQVAGSEGAIHPGSLTFIADTAVLVAVVDDWIKAWDFRTHDPRPLVIARCQGSSPRIQLSPTRHDDVALLSVNRGHPVLHLWSMQVQDPKVTSVRHRVTAPPYMLSDDDGVLRLWDVRTPDSVWLLRKSGVKSMAFTGGELAVLAQADDDSLLLWDVARLTSAKRP